MNYGFKKILGFSVLVLLFSAILLVSETLILSFDNKAEEDFIEESIYDIPVEKEKLDYIDLAKDILYKKEKQKQEVEKRKSIAIKLERLKTGKKIREREEEIRQLASARQLDFTFIPESFSTQADLDKKLLGNLLESSVFKDFFKTLTISFFEERIDVRGKMKKKIIKLFGPQDMKEDELLAIFIHEFSHYIDLYFLERADKLDVSNRFYDLSWYSTIVMNAGLEGKDFVSGYAMTNKYEDFAESLTYYVFHNDDFVVKTQDSDILNAKYNFIQNAIFGDDSFVGTDFSNGNKIKTYYRDITKIDFSKKNFLQYVKNSI